jgi:hypothetical protein
VVILTTPASQPLVILTIGEPGSLATRDRPQLGAPHRTSGIAGQDPRILFGWSVPSRA